MCIKQFCKNCGALINTIICTNPLNHTERIEYIVHCNKAPGG